MGKTVAITGINSYFASTLLPKLEEDPTVDKIIGIDLTPWKGGSSKVEFHKEDIRSENLLKIFKGVDVVYHLAFIVGEIQNKKMTFDININGSRNVFNACVENKVKKVIYTSSATVYGSHEDNPSVFYEDSPLRINEDNYYSKSKVEVENFVSDFFKEHPEIKLTIIRAALLFGPNINNMFSKLYELPVSALPMGSKAGNQYIHEEDLGTALHIAYEKDIPGIYNVGADDSLPTAESFKKGGVMIIRAPLALLKPLVNIGFKLRMFPAGGSWASMSMYSIFINSDKFKNSTGWKPKYSSPETFDHFLESRKRYRKDNLFFTVLSWAFRQSYLLVPYFKGLNIIFMLGKIPGVRKVFSWTSTKKNSMTYLPVNKSLQKNADTVLPPQVLFDIIDKSSIFYLLDTCGCRNAQKCEHFPYEVGCLFMGESAKKLPAGIGHMVSKEKAIAHAKKAIDLGLVPLTGKVRVDNSLFFVRDKKKLLTVCFCCHCCCMMRSFKYTPGKHLDDVMTPVEGLKIEVTEDCIGCSTCIETCPFEAISINGKAVHSEQCRGCGRCERFCPNKAVKISIDNPNFREDVEKRIESYVEIS